MSLTKKKQVFNVLEYDFNTKTCRYYDILPYFRRCWKERNTNSDKKPCCMQELKEWIEKKSSYQYRARCEYEFLMAAWPFGSYKMGEEVMEYLNTHPDFDMKNYDNNVDFTNIIIRDTYKIDIHEQIMMNIDIITDILADEFLK